MLRGETDKHLDKLNKAITQSFWGCVCLSSGPQTCTYKGAGLFVWVLWKRFVESVKKTNYILTFLHVFVFVLPAGCGVRMWIYDRAICHSGK